MRGQLSPGGALLRNSRIFTLPKPLKEPTTSAPRGATTHYPTHQVITTTSKSRMRRDWGLKTLMPKRLLNGTKTPLIRINSLSAPEGVPDYHPAADHALNLERFRELGLAITLPTKASAGHYSTAPVRPISVFDSEYDFTTHDKNTADRRWKFSGPWLADMSEGDFRAFLESKVRTRHTWAAFEVFVRKAVAERINEQDAAAARDGGRHPPAPLYHTEVCKATAGGRVASDSPFSPGMWLPPRAKSKQLWVAELNKLWNDRSELYRLVARFLDLPPMDPPPLVALREQSGVSSLDFRRSQSPWSEGGTPPSHPSAGLSYLRSNARMANHPVYGPQVHKTPFRARLLKPRKWVGKLGLGGFVVDIPTEATGLGLNREQQEDNKGFEFRFDKHGGRAKTWVVPEEAHVGRNGAINVKVGDPSRAATLVQRELLAEDIHEAKNERGSRRIERKTERASAALGALKVSSPSNARFAAPVNNKAGAYGVDL